MSFKSNYKNGIENEKRILKILKEKFKDKDNQIRLNEDKYGFYDIIDEINERFYEIKKRNYDFNCFGNWMLGLDKYLEFKKLKKINKKYIKYTLFFIQSNKDNDYFTIINKKKIINIQNFKREDRIDKIDVEKEYLYIESVFFKKLEKLKIKK